MKSLMIGNSWLWTGLVYGLSALVLVAALANRARIAHFFGEVRAELVKCTWPWDPEQTGFRKYRVLIDSTIVVCVSTLLLGGYTTGFDYVISNLISGLTRLIQHL